MLLLKRVYDPIQEDDGYRILIDRIWPRGLTKENAQLGSWAKEIAPTTVLRKEFNHQPEKYTAFRKAYLAELSANSGMLDFIANVQEHLIKENVTLVYGAKDKEHNHGIVLKDYLMLQGLN